MGRELFNDGSHACVMYSDLVTDGGEAVQANQFLIIDHGHAAVLDPGGTMTYNQLFIGLQKYCNPKDLDLILASHADPDIVGSVNRWMVGTEAKVYVSAIWSRFIPHFCQPGRTDGRIVAIPDPGMRIPLGKSHVIAVPAHFLHAEGNFQFFDPVSRILFTGDMGVSLVGSSQAGDAVTDFDAHVKLMEGFHRRYMTSNKIIRLWSAMVRQLDPEALVPQHGKPMIGKPLVRRFLDWIDTVPCGVDLMTQESYRIPA